VRLLIVEDEPKTASYAQIGLGEHGFVVDVASNGVNGGYVALSSDRDRAGQLHDSGALQKCNSPVRFLPGAES